MEHLWLGSLDLRDRAPLFVTLSDGDIRNGYTFKISNMTRYAKDYSLELAGVSSATLAVIGEGREPESVLPDSVLRGRAQEQFTTFEDGLLGPRGRGLGGLDLPRVVDASPAVCRWSGPTAPRCRSSRPASIQPHPTSISSRSC